jgi:hypothetical protein
VQRVSRIGHYACAVTSADDVRRPWGFVDAVESSFAFLLGLGFCVVAADAVLVRYESADTFVTVSQDSGYDLDFTVGLLANPRDGLSMYEILTSAGAHAPLLRPTSHEQMRSDVAQLAGVFREYGGAALRGESALYDKVREMRRVYTEQFQRRDVDRAKFPDSPNPSPDAP